MNFTYENQGHNTFLVYELSDLEEIDSLSLGMLSANDIPNLLKVTFVQMDLKRYIKYNISSKISAKQLFMGTVNKRRLISVFSGIVNAMMAAEEYMLNTDMIMLDMDYIFTDVSSNDTVMICLPIMTSEYKQSPIGVFFKNIMFSTQFDQSENCDYVAKIINHLNSAKVFSLETFKTLLNSLRDDVESVDTRKDIMKAAAIENNPIQTPNVYRDIQNSQPVVTNVSIPSPGISSESLNTTSKKQKKESTGFSIPGMENTQEAPQENQTAEETDEKAMNLFYLLQHFSSENLQTYKNQKSNKKSKKSAGKTKTDTDAETPFAIPGQGPSPINNTGNFSGSQGDFSVKYEIPIANNSPSQPTFDPIGVQNTGGINNNISLPTSSNPLVNDSFNSSQDLDGGFGGTTVLSYDNSGDTTVLGVGSPIQKSDPYLIRIKTNEKIPINQPIFRIGKERSFVNYFIGDNTAISRSHASIITNNNKYFVVDTNSTNHTYVDGQMIQSNSEVEISDGTKIKLGNEEFEFKIF